LGPYQERINELLDESEILPRKQRYTVKKIFQIIRKEGYQGCEGGVHNYVCRRRKKRQEQQAFKEFRSYNLGESYRFRQRMHPEFEA